MSQPDWIVEPLSPSDIAAVCQAGCASGAYMPACRYRDAVETMAHHGNAVLQYLEDVSDGLPDIPAGSSWDGIACFYLSAAVDLWCLANEGLANWDDDAAIVWEAA